MKPPTEPSATVTVTPIAQGVQGKVLIVAVTGYLAGSFIKTFANVNTSLSIIFFMH
jgi:hypothetical protein